VLQKPSGVVLRDVKKIQTTVITIMITTVVLGMIFTFFLTYKNSKPIRETLTSLRNISGGEKIGTKDDFDYLKGSVSRLISSNKNLQEKIQNQRPLIQMTFLHSLLNSKFEQEEEIIDTFKEVGLPLPEKHILVAAVRILRRSSDGNSLSMDEINGVKILLKEYLEANIPFNHYSYELDIHSLIFIFHFDETIKQPKEEIKDAARMIKEHLAKYHRISVRFSGGGIYSALLQIHQSFREAEAALEYKSIPENTPVSWYSAIPCKSSGPYFPVDSEMQLITCLKAGDCSGSIKILEELYTENYINNKLSLEKEKQFVNSLIGIFNRVFAGVPFATSDPANRIMESENMPQMFSRLKELCRETCDLINKNKKSHNERLKEEVIHFIGKNYSDSMISLTSLADQFHVTAPYLSQFFKEQMGINFSVYLENMRIDEARELMQSTDLSIAEVAAQVGYNSPHVFRKAFKRKEGIKPSEYKEDQLSSMS
jgi:AraC-like DNA-binding protein